MSHQVSNAQNLYLRGIRDGEVAEVLANYMGDSYTQHSTRVPDEKEGFAAFFEDFFQRNLNARLKLCGPSRMAIWSLSMSTSFSMAVRSNG